MASNIRCMSIPRGGYDVVYMGETYQVRSDWQFG
jgi:hypothetical protein